MKWPPIAQTGAPAPQEVLLALRGPEPVGEQSAGPVVRWLPPEARVPRAVRGVLTGRVLQAGQGARGARAEPGARGAPAELVEREALPVIAGQS